MSEKIIAQISQEREDAVLEVALVHDDETGLRVELRSLIWGTGLGWYRQQTLTMNRAAARALIQSLQQAHRQIGGASAPGRKVIPFPRPYAPPVAAEPETMQR